MTPKVKPGFLGEAVLGNYKSSTCWPPPVALAFDPPSFAAANYQTCQGPIQRAVPLYNFTSQSGFTTLTQNKRKFDRNMVIGGQTQRERQRWNTFTSMKNLIAWTVV